MKTPKTESTDQKEQAAQLSREKVIQALAVALLIDTQAGIEMAGCEPALFVQSARKAVQTLADHVHVRLTDDDLREVHWHLRRHVSQIAYVKGLPVLPMVHGRIAGLKH